MDASGVCGLKIAWTRSDAAYVCLAKKKRIENECCPERHEKQNLLAKTLNS
jgi:hypothetical protein